LGLGIFKNCSSGYTIPAAPAPNPDPSRFRVLKIWNYNHGYVLKVEYLDATNFEGVKIMVYKGKCPSGLNFMKLDPHFSEDDLSPVARFRPDDEGITMARDLAASFKGEIE
jgi:hypothetical protein